MHLQKEVPCSNAQSVSVYRCKAKGDWGILQYLSKKYCPTCAISPRLFYRNLKLFRQFYLTYRQLGQKTFGALSTSQIGQTFGQFQLHDNQLLEIVQTSAQSFETDPELLLNRLSFSQIVLIMSSALKSRR